MNQSDRYTDLSLKEEDLIAGQKHLLCAYVMKPKAGHEYLQTAAHFAAQSSTGTNVDVSTTDDFTRGIDALVYEIDPDRELMKIAFPLELFDFNMIDGSAMISSFQTVTIGSNQAMGDVEYAKMHDFYIPRPYLDKFDRPATTINDLRQVLGRTDEDGGFIISSVIKPRLGLRPKPFADVAFNFWLGGDFIKNDEPQGNQSYAPMKFTIPLVAEAMLRAQNATGKAKLFSANITADDPAEMIARGEFILESFGENASHVAFLVDGFVAGPAAVTTVRRNFPDQFLHCQRSGHGAITSPQSKRGYTALVLAKMSRMTGASAIHIGAMGHGKTEGEPGDIIISHMIEEDSAPGAYYHQDWFGSKPTAPIISGGMNALRLPGFFDHMGHSDLILMVGGGIFGHIDGPAAGAISLRQAEQCWREKADPVVFALENREFARAFESFTTDADTLYPGWRNRLTRAA